VVDPTVQTVGVDEEMVPGASPLASPLTRVAVAVKDESGSEPAVGDQVSDCVPAVSVYTAEAVPAA
jgi:hypothetical protein